MFLVICFWEEQGKGFLKEGRGFEFWIKLFFKAFSRQDVFLGFF